MIKEVTLGRPLHYIPGGIIAKKKLTRAHAPKVVDNKALVVLIKTKVSKETFEGWLAELDATNGKQDTAA